MFLILPNLGLFGPLRATFGVGVRLKIFFGTYLCRQSTLVLEVQQYLFVFNLAAGASFALFGPLGLFSGSGSDSIAMFGTYLCSEPTLILEVQPCLFVLKSAKLVAYFAILGFLGGWGQVKKLFRDLIT